MLFKFLSDLGLHQFDLTIANTDWIREYDIDQNLFHIGSRHYSYSENIGYFMDKETILSIRTTGEVVNFFATLRDFFESEIDAAEQIMIAKREESGN